MQWNAVSVRLAFGNQYSIPAFLDRLKYVLNPRVLPKYCVTRSSTFNSLFLQLAVLFQASNPTMMMWFNSFHEIW